MSYLTSLLLVSVPVSYRRIYFLPLYLFFGFKHFWRENCMCVYSLLCLREGEAEGEGTEVRGAGMGHLRTGSSMILLLSISSIIYSTSRRRGWRRCRTRRDETQKNWNYVGNKEEKDTQAGRRVWRRMWGWREGGWGRRNISEAFYWINITAQPSAW